MWPIVNQDLSTLASNSSNPFSDSPPNLFPVVTISSIGHSSLES